MIDALLIDGLTGAAGASLIVALARRRSAEPRVPVLLGALPYRHRRRVRKIVKLARECAARHPKGSLEAFTANETLRAYLPDTIAAYLAVPRGLRAARRARGRSPDDELRSQLRTLRAALERIQQAEADAAATRMAANAAFLNERFGPPPAEEHAPNVALIRDAVNELSAYVRRARTH